MRLTGPIDWGKSKPRYNVFYKGFVILSVCNRCGAFLTGTVWKYNDLWEDGGPYAYCDDCAEMKARIIYSTRLRDHRRESQKRHEIDYVMHKNRSQNRKEGL